MIKQVQIEEDEVKLIIFALRHTIVPIDKEKQVWDLIEKLEREMNR